MTTRRAFLAASAALAAAPGVASATTPGPSASPSEEPLPKLRFDVEAFDALLDRDVPHKHLFTARHLDAGGVFEAVRSTLNAYADTGVTAQSVAPAVVLYHTAIIIGVDDYAWKTYIDGALAAMRKDDPQDGKNIDELLSAKGANPSLVRGKPPWDASIQALVADTGMRIFICNNALGGFAHELAHRAKKRAADVYADLCAHLVPNATIVPAGVWAVHAIQEKKYTLLQTS